MKKVFLLSLLASVISPVSSFAEERVLNLSGNCKLYLLAKKNWVETKADSLDGITIPERDILKNETFTVFKVSKKTYGINERCLQAREPTPVERRAAAPAPVRGDTHSPWAAVFSLGYNVGTKATRTATYLGATATETVKYKSTISFLGEANYRVNAAFRVAGELGISQLSVDTLSGNETSFFDIRPEYIFRAGPKFEIYLGPMLGVFILSQNAEPGTLSSGEQFTFKQQTASALLLGIGVGADYALTRQFDLGLFFRYFKPGDLSVSATETFPTPGNTYDIKMAVSYWTTGARFAIHF